MTPSRLLTLLIIGINTAICQVLRKTALILLTHGKLPSYYKVRKLPLWLLIGLGLITLVGCKRSADYLPLAVGNTWVYDTQIGDQHIRDVVRRVSSEKFPNYPKVSTIITLVGNIAGKEYWASDSNGVYEVISSFQVPNAGTVVPVLELPIKAGAVFKKSEKLTGTDITREISHRIIGIEHLKLAVGEVRAVHIEQTVSLQRSDMERSNTIDYWFTRYLGIVQEKRTVNGQVMTLRLKEFSVREK
jgi:hypothetical protein